MAERRPAYDESERERIRRSLLRYKEQHQAGVPTLQLRIAEAIGDQNPDRVPIKSLQRFLAASHRTDDALVHHCAIFLTKVAPPPAEERLADMLGQFLMEETALDAPCSTFIGTYHGRFRTERVTSLKDRYEHAYSVLSLRDSGQPHYLIAEELVFNWDRAQREVYKHPDIFRTATEPLPARYSGIFMRYVGGDPPVTSYLLLLRNYVHMQQYLLSTSGRTPPYTVAGTGHEPPLRRMFIAPHWTSDFYIEFSPAPVEAQA